MLMAAAIMADGQAATQMEVLRENKRNVSKSRIFTFCTDIWGSLSCGWQPT